MDTLMSSFSCALNDMCSDDRLTPQMKTLIDDVRDSIDAYLEGMDLVTYRAKIEAEIDANHAEMLARTAKADTKRSPLRRSAARSRAKKTALSKKAARAKKKLRRAA